MSSLLLSKQIVPTNHFSDCNNAALIGDGFCHDETNNAYCNYDGGDCCGSCILNNQCTECACLGGADVINPIIGNEFCNDEANTAECYYDGGDCCKFNAMY